MDIFDNLIGSDDLSVDTTDISDTANAFGETETDVSFHQRYPQAAISAFELLTEVNDQALLVLNSDFIVEYTNPKMANLLEVDINEYSAPFRYLDVIERIAERGDFGPGDVKQFTSLIKDVLTNQLAGTVENLQSLAIVTPTGRRIRLDQVVNSDQRIFITARETTSYYYRKKALAKALTLGKSGYSIFQIETGRFLLNGDALYEIFGQDKTDGNLIDDIWGRIHKDDIGKARDAWENALKTGAAYELTFRSHNQYGRVTWTKTVVSPQFAVSGQVVAFICFFTDVTETLRVQDELRRKTEEAQQALKAKNSFLGKLSHEVRTPMNAVIGIADALLHHHHDPAIKPKLDLIQNSAEKIVRIVDESLQHTKLEENKVELNPRMQSPAKSIETVCRLWEEHALKNNIKLTYQCDPGVPDEIFFDDFRYEQCANNLLSNAIKFTPNGEVTVLLTTVTNKLGQDSLVLAVRDTGIGMTPAQQDNIFEAFTQADKSISGRFGGTGLGMNITKQIIELMGGKITMRSAAGQGSVFALTLPIRTESDISDDTTDKSSDLVADILEAQVPEQSDYSNLRILVVDDNATNHMVISSLLGSVVGEIVTADNGQEAIDILSQQTFDIVLMDIHMPVMDGIEATLTIRSNQTDYQHVPIIALTADPQYQQKRLCKNIGMDEALAKPVKLTEILHAIDIVRDKIDAFGASRSQTAA